MYLDLFGNPVPVAQPKPRKKAASPNPSQGGLQGEYDEDYYALSESSLLGRGKGEAVSRSLRDLGIHGQEAAFYTAMRQATKMAPHSIRCVIDALAQYAATCLAEERDARIPGLCVITSRHTEERTTQVADKRNGGAVVRTIPAHRKVKIKPTPDLLRRANAAREEGSLEFK